MRKPPIFQNPEMDGSTFLWDRGQTGVLMLHGFTATTVEVRKLAKLLNDRGFSTYGPLLPGHGTTPTDLNKVKWQDWVATAELSLYQLKEKCEKVFILGESMGALVSLYLCVTHPEILGAMIFAPALRIRKLWISRLLWPFVKYTYKSNTDDSMPWQGYNVVPLKGASELRKFQKKLKVLLSKIRTPLIVFQGRLDGTIDPMGSLEVFEEVDSEVKEFVELEESSHCILLDKQLREVEEICVRFMSERLNQNE